MKSPSTATILIQPDSFGQEAQPDSDLLALLLRGDLGALDRGLNSLDTAIVAATVASLPNLERYRLLAATGEVHYPLSREDWSHAVTAGLIPWGAQQPERYTELLKLAGVAPDPALTTPEAVWIAEADFEGFSDLVDRVGPTEALIQIGSVPSDIGLKARIRTGLYRPMSWRKQGSYPNPKRLLSIDQLTVVKRSLDRFLADAPGEGVDFGRSQPIDILTDPSLERLFSQATADQRTSIAVAAVLCGVGTGFYGVDDWAPEGALAQIPRMQPMGRIDCFDRSVGGSPQSQSWDNFCASAISPDGPQAAYPIEIDELIVETFAKKLLARG